MTAAGQAGAAPGGPGHRTGLCGPGRADTAYTDRLCAAEGDLLDVRIGDVRVSRAQSALPASSPVAEDLTVGDLGAPAEWNAGKAAEKGEFAKLSVPYAEAKPGKLAYALRYKDAHGIG